MMNFLINGVNNNFSRYTEKERAFLERGFMGKT